MNEKRCLSFLFMCVFCISSNIYSAQYNPQHEMKFMYEIHCSMDSDLKDHLNEIKNLAKECASVVEISRSSFSIWGILEGLSESVNSPKSYLGVDPDYPLRGALDQIGKMAEEVGISFEFWQVNSLKMHIPVTDMLFIDSLHTYCHLTYELETFSPRVNKYIVIHDTSWPWGNADEAAYSGDYSEYPENYDRKERGLWPAVEDFLSRHFEWSLMHRRMNCHGLTILIRTSD
jgi:hypothetical protein